METRRLLKVLVVALAVAGCQKDRGRARSPSADPDGTWVGPCVPGPGDTSRRSTYVFRQRAGTVEIRDVTYRTTACTDPRVLSYVLTGTYQASAGRSLEGAIREVSLAIHAPDYLRAANRAPGLYGRAPWLLDAAAPLSEKAPPGFLAQASEAAFPKGLEYRIERDRLYLGETGLGRAASGLGHR